MKFRSSLACPYTCAVFTLVLVTILHSFAVKYAWYWTIRWIDLPVHFMAGMAVGFFGIHLWTRFSLFRYYRKIYFVLIVVLLIGITWEFFEFITGIQDVLAPQEISDTILDLAMDISGSLVAYFLASFLCCHSVSQPTNRTSFSL